MQHRDDTSSSDPPFTAASPIQRALEEHALRLWCQPTLRQARERAASAFEAEPQAARGRDTLNRDADEMLFNHCMRTVNGDGERPRIMAAGFPPHRWDGLSVPGGRFCGNNPDTCYRYVPIDGAAAYEILGRLARPGPTDFSIMLPAIDRESGAFRVLGVLSESDLALDASGRFRVTIDPSPAGGRPNHIQNARDAQGLQIRDTLMDWQTETPHPISIRHVGASKHSERSDAELCALFDQGVDAYVHGWLAWMRAYCYANPLNSLPAPMRVPRGLATQIGASGHFELNPGDALVVSLAPMAAAYLGLEVADPWCVCADYDTRLRSLNMHQARPDDDGRFTFVVSPSDPGVFNWIETHGLPSGTLFVRWQGLTSDFRVPAEALRCRLTRIDALPGILGPAAPQATPREREAQRAARAAGLSRREWSPR